MSNHQATEEELRELALRHWYWKERRRAVRHLAQHHSVQTIATLISVVRHDQDHDVVEAAVLSLLKLRAFEALERIIPEADDMQRRMAETRNPAAPTLADFELVPEGYDDFTHLVRDALSQYWGGPRAYSQLRGHPRLRMRYAGFAIGPAQRGLQPWMMSASTSLPTPLSPVISTRLWESAMSEASR